MLNTMSSNYLSVHFMAAHRSQKWQGDFVCFHTRGMLFRSENYAVLKKRPWLWNSIWQPNKPAFSCTQNMMQKVTDFGQLLLVHWQHGANILAGSNSSRGFHQHYSVQTAWYNLLNFAHKLVTALGLSGLLVTKIMTLRHNCIVYG